MRKSISIVSICVLAGAIWSARHVTRGHRAPSPGEPSSIAAHRGGPSRGGVRGDPTAASMPPQDERVAALLAEHPVDDALRDQLIAVARSQALGFAPRDPEQDETPVQRAARRAERVAFRRQVRDAIAAMPDPLRAAMRRHRVDVVRLGRALDNP